MYIVTLKENKEKQLLKHHPWVFSGAIKSVEPRYTSQDIAKVVTSDNRFVAYGYYDEKSHIILHLQSWDEDVIPDDSFLIHAIKAAILRRKHHFNNSDTNAFRLIHAEADFIPGLVADLYNTNVRLIISSRYAYFKIDVIIKTLVSTIKPSLITVYVDKEYAKAEALSQKIRYFNKEGEEIDRACDNIRFKESGLLYEIENTNSQKSGFYVDQRDNRKILEEYFENKTVLDACSYTGSFTLHALRANALCVDALDSSESALRHLLYQVNLNESEGLIPSGSRERVTITCCDVFEHLRVVKKDYYDFIILDPPKLAKTKSQAQNALKAYKDINRVAIDRVQNGGLIASFSCSGAISREDLKQAIAFAAADNKCEIQILRVLSAGDDHPIRISFSESEYLKGFLYRVIK